MKHTMSVQYGNLKYITRNIPEKSPNRASDIRKLGSQGDKI